MEQPQAGNYLWGCVFSPRDPRAKRLVNRVRIALRTPTASQLTWFWVAMGNTQGSRGFTFPGLTGKQARTQGPRPFTLASSPPRPFAALTTQPCPLPAPRLYLGRHQRQHSSSSGSELSELWLWLRLIRLCLKACDASALASFFSRPWPPPRRSSYASPSPPLCPSCALSSQPWHLLFWAQLAAHSRQLLALFRALAVALLLQLGRRHRRRLGVLLRQRRRHAVPSTAGCCRPS